MLPLSVLEAPKTLENSSRSKVGPKVGFGGVPESRSKVGQKYTNSYTFDPLLTYFQGPPETYFQTYSRVSQGDVALQGVFRSFV